MVRVKGPLVLRIGFLVGVILLIALFFIFFSGLRATAQGQLSEIQKFPTTTVGVIAAIFIIAAGALGFVEGNDETSVSVGYHVFLLFNIAIMLYFAGAGVSSAQASQIFFYVLLALFASAILLYSKLDSIWLKSELLHIDTHAEKDAPHGFEIPHVQIPPRWVLPLWVLIFIATGFVVRISGNALVGYPEFGILDKLQNSLIISFGVAEWENVALMIGTFVLTKLALKNRLEEPLLSIPAFVASLVVFLIYHTFRYPTNVIALVAVFIFAGVSMTSYILTRSLVPMSAFHTGSNFWASLFKLNVFGFAIRPAEIGTATTTTTLGSLMGTGIELLIVMAAISFIHSKEGLLWVRR